MRSGFKSKKYIVILLSLAFISRLLLTNIGPIFTISASQDRKHNSSFSTDYLKQKRNTSEIVDMAGIGAYPALAFFEESTDTEENEIDSDSAVLLYFTYSSFKKNGNSSLSINPFDFTNYNLLPKKYLALSTLRI